MIFLDAAFSPLELAAGILAVLLPLILGVLILCAAIVFIIVFVQKKKKAQSLPGAVPVTAEQPETPAAEEPQESETPKTE